MNSSQFIEALRRIGYPRANSLDPESLDWAFELSATSPFLEWFCNGITENNVVSEEEMDEYKQLEESGNSLSGPDLEEALKAMVDSGLPQDSPESDVERLKETLARAKAQKNALMTHCSKLSVHHMAMRNKVTKMEEVEEQELKAYRQAVEKCNSQNVKLGEALHSLLESVQKIIALYRKPRATSADGDQPEDIHFLSQLDLKAFFEAEEKFSHDLTAFTKKQFFEGMAGIAGERESETYDLVDVRSPEMMSLKARGTDSFMQDCQEFTRLQQIFPKSECDRINALVNAKKALAALNEAKSVRHTLKSGQFPTSPSEISRLHHNVEQSIEAVKTEVEPLQKTLPDLIRQLGGLQGTEILTGDYDLKLRRQDYIVKKQEKVIEHLVSQRARNEFLVMLYDLETRCHRETHHLLSAARQMLETNLQAWQQRMKDLEDPDLSIKKFERSVVDARDTSTARLYKLLGDSDEDEKMLYLPKQKVVQKAKDLHNHHSSAAASDQTLDGKYFNKVSQLETCVADCESVLYAGSSTSIGQPALSPSAIQSAMATLTSQIATLEADISAIITEVNCKQMTLKNNLLLSKERELFILFHNNPSRLLYVVNGLADRLKAQDIK